MRVPVRLSIQHAHGGLGVRRAWTPGLGRAHGLAVYGGDVRTYNPISLVLHGLGDDVDPGGGVPQTYDITAPSEPTTSVTYPDILTSPSGPYQAPASDSTWWQDFVKNLPAIAGSTAVMAQIIRGGPPRAGVTSYIVPATATTPAQRVVYNAATGQVTTTPVLAAGSALPAFLQAAPGAAWYQNPVVLLGGGLAALVLLMARKR